MKHFIYTKRLILLAAASVMGLSLAVPSPAQAACSSPTGAAGDQIYNSTVSLMQFCNGTNWINMGSPIASETDPQVGTLTNTKWCTSDGTVINCTTSAPSGADNLGNHVATQNIQLGSYWLSGDGGNEGVQVNSSGAVSVGNSVTNGTILNLLSERSWKFSAGSSGATTELLLSPAVDAKVFKMVSQDLSSTYFNLLSHNTPSSATLALMQSGGAISIGTAGNVNLSMNTGKITNLGTPTASADAATKAYVDAQISSGGADNLGNHTATQNIQLGSYWLSGDGGNEGVFVNASGQVGIGTSSIGAKLDVAGDVDMGAGTGWTYLDIKAGAAGNDSVIRLYADTDYWSLHNDDSAANEFNLRYNNSAKLAIDTSGNVTIPTGTLNMSSHKITSVTDPTAAQDAATKAYVDGLTGSNETDPQVNAVTSGKWCRGTGSQVTCDQNAPTGDNLGNHTATQDLAMSSYQISYGTNTGDHVYWYSNTYGTGIESGTLTNWSGSNHRWRIGGTSVSTGTEEMLLNSSGLNITDGIFVNGGLMKFGPDNTTGSTQTGISSGRLYTAPYDDAAFQWGREFGYDPSLNTWYVESGFSITGGALNMNSQKVVNLATPTAAADAATKAYVDGLTGSSETDPQVNAVTSGKWCRGTGTQVTCDQNAPSGLGSSCAATGTLTWGNCSGSALPSGEDKNVEYSVDASSTWQGMRTYQCRNGTWTAVRSTCVDTSGSSTGSSDADEVYADTNWLSSHTDAIQRMIAEGQRNQTVY